MHCGFIPANTFIMADLAEPVTHCRGYISGPIPATGHLPPTSLHAVPSHPNFDPILAGISRILTKPLFFNDLPTLFLDAFTQKETRSPLVHDAPVRRYGRVTIHQVGTRAFATISQPLSNLEST